MVKRATEKMAMEDWATGKLVSGKIWLQKIRGWEKRATKINVRNNGNRKKGTEKWATENWATGKLRNKKWTSRKKGQHKAVVRKKWQRYFRLQKKWQPWIQIPSLTELVTEKMVTGKTSNRKMGNGPKRRGNGDKAITDVS